MADERPDERQMPRKFNFLRVPLFRLLAINLAAGVALATLLVGGLLMLNPGGLRDLILAGDGSSRQQNYLASEDGFQFVKGLQAHDRVIPVVGNLTGPSALVGIGRWLREHDERLSVFYASNVEFYLFRDGTFDRFVDNLGHIPHASRALLIRSIFGYGGGSVSQTQPVPDLLDGAAHGRYRDYWQLVR